MCRLRQTVAGKCPAHKEKTLLFTGLRVGGECLVSPMARLRGEALRSHFFSPLLSAAVPRSPRHWTRLQCGHQNKGPPPRIPL